MRVIAADVGGTKTLLRLADVEGGIQTTIAQERVTSGAHASFSALLGSFLRNAASTADAACFAVAGPVNNGVAHLTNLDWTVDGTQISRELDIPRVAVVNDFFAVASGVPFLQAGDLVELNRGDRDPSAPIAVLGAGTGLGEAVVVPRDRSWIVIPSEGGHADFAPTDDEQIELLRFLRRSLGGHVSYERVVSGHGLSNIYAFLSEREGERLELDAAKIAANAGDGDRLAANAVRIFIDVYGAEAGNLALKVLARGGVYLTGGVGAKNRAWFTDGAFMHAFRAKGRFSALMDEIPVHLVVNQEVGLLGAMAIAAALPIVPGS